MLDYNTAALYGGFMHIYSEHSFVGYPNDLPRLHSGVFLVCGVVALPWNAVMISVPVVSLTSCTPTIHSSPATCSAAALFCATH